MSPDGRRVWAFAATCGGCMVFTVFAGIGVYLLQNDPEFTFWLAIAAHVQILVGMTGFGWVLGRRMQIEAGKNGAIINDGGGADHHGH